MGTSDKLNIILSKHINIKFYYNQPFFDFYYYNSDTKLF